MDYDEIDDYVNQLFKQEKSGGSGDDNKPLSGEVISGDWRIDRIDQIIEDAYQDAIWWHNHRISEGCDPRSGLRNLPYVPWDENIDGVAAMQGAVGSIDAQPIQYGQARRLTEEEIGYLRAKDLRDRSGNYAGRSEERVSDTSMLAALAVVLIAFVTIGCLCASLGEFVRIP